MPESVGSGAAIFDFDGDGRMDLFLLQNAGTNSNSRHQLFHQENDGRFRNVSAGSGLDLPGLGMGVAIGDVDNDGHPDVFITEYDQVHLFRNLGGGKFSDITAESGIANPNWGTSAAFFDYDRDGWLDLIVVNYVDYDPTKPCGGVVGRLDFCGPHAFPGTVAKLFHNRGATRATPGDAARPSEFDDVTVEAGL